MKLLRYPAAIALSFVLACPAVAQVSITAFGGYAVSEGIDNDITGERASVKSGGTFGVAADYDLDGSRQLHCSTASRALARTPVGPAALRLNVRYLLGGTYFFDGPIGRGPYAVGGLGVTHFTPDLGGLQSETRASLNVGFGYVWPLGSAVAVRAEARAFLTLLNSSGGLFCSGGCTVVLSGDGFAQGQAMVGLTAKF